MIHDSILDVRCLQSKLSLNLDTLKLKQEHAKERAVGAVVFRVLFVRLIS